MPATDRRPAGATSDDRTTVISIIADAFAWTAGDALWDVGMPQVSPRDEVLDAARYQADLCSKQRVGVRASEGA
jgi:3D-(3,5/4)-trihydroxycyclohexane-1,2-dione acylhydrolase (decyclizing)